jgi:hypothetical protein
MGAARSRWHAREQWKDLKAQGFTAAYWRQDAAVRWFKKA